RRLVRADGHQHAGVVQLRERRLDVRQHLRLLATDLVVAALESLGHAGRHVLGVERALEQLLQPVADATADALAVELGQAVLPARVGHGLVQRVVGIDERSIEIEKHSAVTEGGGHGHDRERQILSRIAAASSPSIRRSLTSSTFGQASDDLNPSTSTISVSKSCSSARSSSKRMRATSL